MRLPRMHTRWWASPLAGAAVLLALAATLDGPAPLRRQACWPLLWNYDEVLDLADDFEGFDNETGVFSSSAININNENDVAGVDRYRDASLVVPNIVHFLRLGAASAEFTFVEFVCVLAAWRRQRPDWLMFHTDQADFRGALWQRLQAEPGLGDAVQLVPARRETHVFGQPLAAEHADDVARLRILAKYGGIFLGSEAYLLRSLDPLRRYEMTLAWPAGGALGTQVVVAHPSARLLALWLESYRSAYAAALPKHYAAALRPTLLALHARPELVHREPERLAPEGPDAQRALYLRRDLDALLDGESWWRPLSRPWPYDASFWLFMAMLWVLWYINQATKMFVLFPRHIECKSRVLANVADRFEGLDNTAELAEGAPELVPNVVHFVRLGEAEEELRPDEAACISAALRTQPGCTVVVHTDREALRGVAWGLLRRQAGARLRVQRRPRPAHVFGLPFRDAAARHRVTALRVLMKYGGVYVANTAYLRADLSAFRRYEAAVVDVRASRGSPSSSSGPAVILAHRDARLLRRWLHHFHDADLVWEQRPPAPRHLYRAIADAVSDAVVVDVAGLMDPALAAQPSVVSSEDWYLWASAQPAPRDWLGSWL